MLRATMRHRSAIGPFRNRSQLLDEAKFARYKRLGYNWTSKGFLRCTIR